MIALLAAWTLAATGSVGAEVQARAGYDTNIFYASEASLDDPTSGAPQADAFAALAPRLAGELALGGFHLGAALDALLVQYAQYDNGHYQLVHLALAEARPLGRVSLGLIQEADAYSISAFRSDQTRRVLVGANAAAVVGPLELGLRLEGALRAFPDREIAYQVTELDQIGAAAAVARWSAGILAVEGAVRGELRDSNAQPLRGRSGSATLDATARKGRLLAALGCTGRWVDLPRFPVSDIALGRQDLELGASGQLGVRWGDFTPGLQLAVQHNASNYDLAVFRRWVASLEVDWQWTLATPTPPPSLVALQPGPGRYRLEVELPGAKQVSVVGSFEGWRAPGLPMTEVSPGRFAVELEVAAGCQRYQLIVDGARQAPPGAPAYQPDEMGGVDGIVCAPGASDPGVGR